MGDEDGDAVKLRVGDRVLVFLSRERTIYGMRSGAQKVLVPGTVRSIDKRRVSFNVSTLVRFVGAKKVVTMSRASEGRLWCRGWEGTQANVLKTVNALAEARS